MSARRTRRARLASGPRGNCKSWRWVRLQPGRWGFGLEAADGFLASVFQCSDPIGAVLALPDVERIRLAVKVAALELANAAPGTPFTPLLIAARVEGAPKWQTGKGSPVY